MLLRTENEQTATNQNKNFVTVPFQIFLNVKQFVRFQIGVVPTFWFQGGQTLQGSPP